MLPGLREAQDRTTPVAGARQIPGYPCATSTGPAHGRGAGGVVFWQDQPLTPDHIRLNPAPMTILESASAAVECRCEALTISDIPPYRCTTSATAHRQGREVCPSHASALHVLWFDDHYEWP
jgi:hypothetical protein